MPEPPDRPVLVIGPGAIGTLVAARLARHGFRVTLACRTRGTADEIAQRGLVAIGVDGGSVAVRVHTVVRPAALDPAPALAILATKCADARTALGSWAPYLPRDCPVVAMQNGLLGDSLVGPSGGRLVECVVAFPATLTAPGRSAQTGPGGFLLGEWPEGNGRVRPTARVREAARILSSVAPVRTSDNLRGAKWTKLLINSAITTLGAVTGSTLGDLLRLRRARQAFLAITTEGYRAGRGLGVRFEPIARFRPGWFALPPQPRWGSLAWRHQLLKLLGRRQRRHKSSSLQSLERGRKTEVGFLNGAIVEASLEVGTAAPVNAALVRLAEDLERGRRLPSLATLDGLPV